MKSNCLFEAVKAKLKAPNNVTIVRIPKRYRKYAEHVHYGWIKDGYYYYALFTNRKHFRYFYDYRIKKKPLIVFQSYFLTNLSSCVCYEDYDRIVQKLTKKWDLPINGKAGFTEWVTYDKENSEGFFPTEEYFKKYYLDYKRLGVFIKIRYSENEKVSPLKELKAFLKENKITVFKWRFMTLWDKGYRLLIKEFTEVLLQGLTYFIDKDELETMYTGEDLECFLNERRHYWDRSSI